MTWFRRDPEVRWFDREAVDAMIAYADLAIKDYFRTFAPAKAERRLPEWWNR